MEAMHYSLTLPSVISPSRIGNLMILLELCDNYMTLYLRYITVATVAAAW